MTFFPHSIDCNILDLLESSLICIEMKYETREHWHIWHNMWRISQHFLIPNMMWFVVMYLAMISVSPSGTNTRTEKSDMSIVRKSFIKQQNWITLYLEIEIGGWGIYCSGANRLIGEVVQSRRRPLLGPSPGWKRLLALSHLRHY